MRASKTAIILLGRPGSGKDTQAELLVKKFNLVHLISTHLIEKSFTSSKKTIKLDGGVYDVKKEQKKFHDGNLVDFNFIAALTEDEIKKLARAKKGLVMSGSMRSLIELEKGLPLLEKLYGKENIYIFHIKISPKEVYIRNLKRKRKDLPELDTKKIIAKRLKVFNQITLPVIKYLKKQKRIVEINGEQPVLPIHKDILKILPKA